jgi:hypothetical protein
VRVQLREQKQGGTAAVVVVPKTLLASAPASSAKPSDTSTVSLPGADAEANSNVLPTRTQPGKPAAQEQSATKEPAEKESAQKPAAQEAEEPPAKPAAEEPAETTMELLLPSPAQEQSPDQPASGKPAAQQPDSKESAPTSAPADGEQPSQGPSAPGHETRTDGAGENAPADNEGEAETTTGNDAEVEAEHQRTPDAAQEPVTAKGLPKRTPRITAPTTPPRQRSASVNAEELRRRLGGFQRGAKAGYRDVEAEIADRKKGGTVEEASS